MHSTSKTVFRILGIVASVLLSVILVAMLIVTPLYTSVTSIIRPQTITDILRNIDFAEILPLDDLVDDAVGDTVDKATDAVAVKGIASDTLSDKVVDGTTDILSDSMKDNPALQEFNTYIKPLLHSTLAEELIAYYVNDATAVINGEATDITLTTDTLRTLTEKHIDDVVRVVRENAPTDSSLTDEQIKQKVLSAIDEHGAQLLNVLPTADLINDLAAGIRNNPVIALVLNPRVAYTLYGAIAVLAVLIFFCLYGGARGLLCLGIDSLIACLPLAATLLIFGDGGLLLDLAGDMESVNAIIRPLISAITGKLTTQTVVIAVVGVLCIAGYIAWTVYKKKKVADNNKAPVSDATPILAE